MPAFDAHRFVDTFSAAPGAGGQLVALRGPLVERRPPGSRGCYGLAVSSQGHRDARVEFDIQARVFALCVWVRAVGVG